MGILVDFREVLKELKHKKVSEAIINLCPKCGSKKISLGSGFDIYPRLYGIVPLQYICLQCGYKGSTVMEQKKEETGFITKDAVPIMISKAFGEARSLALEAGIVSKDIIGELLAKAVAEMGALEDKVGKLEVKEEPAEEPKKEEEKSGGQEEQGQEGTNA